MTATSDNQASVPDANIVLGGTGAARTVTVTATATSGSANVTLLASDGVKTATAVLPVRVNAPPQFQGNSTLHVAQGGSGTITSTLLKAVDPDTASPPIFVVSGQPFAGTLFLNGVASPASFTQADVNNGLVTYTQDGSCNSNDGFQFQIEDVDGAFANDPSQGPGPTTYSFGVAITANQTAPTAQNASYAVALGGTVHASALATTSDCSSPTITYQLVTGPTHGQLTGPDSATGAFTYIASAGYVGTDTFTFTGTTYGSKVSAPATVTFNIQPQSPVAQSASLSTTEATPVSGVLTGTDPNVPAQSLTYALVTQPTKGNVVINDASAGTFTYTPNPGAIGADSFTFTASNATLTSSPATISILIRGKLAIGEVVIADDGDHGSNPPSVVLFDPVTSQQALVSNDPQFGMLLGVTIGNDGNIFVTSEDNSNQGHVYRVDPNTGIATDFADGFGMPVGIAIEADGNILVADLSAGVIRLDPTTGAKIGTTMNLGANTAPAGIAPASDGTFYVSDLGAAFAGATANSIFHVSADGSTVTPITSGGHLSAPTGLVLVGDVLYASNASFGPNGTNDVIQIDMAGTQTVLTSGDTLNGPSGLTFGSSQLYAADAGSAAITGIDPANGTQTSLTSGQFLSSPFAIHALTARPSKTTITSEAPDPAAPGVSYTVSVSVAPAVGTGTPGGSVAVSDGAGGTCNVTLVNGAGSCNLSSSAPGGVTLSASYVGDTTFSPSNASTNHTVGPYPTTTTIVSSGASVVGETYAITVTVSAASGTPDGTISVSDGATPANTCGPTSLASGSATCNIVWSAAGTYNLTATYTPGTPTQFAGGSSTAQAHAVNMGATNVGVSPASGSVVVNHAYAVTVTISPVSPAQGLPTGSVSVSDGASDTCTIASLDNTGAGTCQLTPTSAGNLTISATYGGDANFTGNSGTASLTVNKATSATALSTQCQRVFVSGEPFTATAAVSGFNPSGTVTFLQSGTVVPLCANQLSSGSASCTTSALVVQGSDKQDTYVLTANYAGNTNNAASSSSGLSVTVLSAGDVIFRDGFEAATPSCPID